MRRTKRWWKREPWAGVKDCSFRYIDFYIATAFDTLFWWLYSTGYWFLFFWTCIRLRTCCLFERVAPYIYFVKKTLVSQDPTSFLQSGDLCGFYYFAWLCMLSNGITIFISRCSRDTTEQWIIDERKRTASQRDVCNSMLSVWNDSRLQHTSWDF